MRKLILIFMVIAMWSCNFSDEKRELSGGSCFYSEGQPDEIIAVSKENFIPCQVIKYGYDDDFIIAAQKPTPDCFWAKDTFSYKEGRDKIYYWIVGHKQKLFLGPLNESEFKGARKEYSVSDNLKLESAY